MKKILFVSACLLAAIMAASCASIKKAEPSSGNAPASTGNASASSGNATASTSQSVRMVNSGMPPAIRDAVNNCPEGAFIGVGTAKSSTLNQSMTISEARARAALSRQMDTVVQGMVSDFTADSEIDPSAALSFQENVTAQFTRSRLQGSKIVETYQDGNGNYWTAVMLPKSNGVNEINQAVAAAKLRVPAMASFDAQRRMEAGLDKLYGNEIGYSDKN